MPGLELLNLTDRPAQLQEIRDNIVQAIVKRNQRRMVIPPDELIVVGGAALQMHGIKKTYDIDVVVTPMQMEQVLEETVFRDGAGGKLRKLDRHGVIMTATGRGEGQLIKASEYGSTYGGITYMLAPNDHLYQATFEELRDEAVEIGGVLVSPPERILAWKRGVNRPKDAKDITLIEQYLARLST